LLACKADDARMLSAALEILEPLLRRAGIGTLAVFAARAGRSTIEVNTSALLERCPFLSVAVTIVDGREIYSKHVRLYGVFQGST
jgi:hypothetical protein